jgi:hypothetical protein
MELEVLFSRRVSSFLSLLLVILIATGLGAWIISESQKLKTLEKPMPFYIADLAK